MYTQVAQLWNKTTPIILTTRTVINENRWNYIGHCSITITYHRTDLLFPFFPLPFFLSLFAERSNRCEETISANRLFNTRPLHTYIYISFLNFISKGSIVLANSVHRHTLLVNHRLVNYRLIALLIDRRWAKPIKKRITNRRNPRLYIPENRNISHERSDGSGWAKVKRGWTRGR